MVVHSGLPPLHHRLNLFVLILLLIIKFGFFNLALSQKLPEAEVEALEEIAKTIGMKDWNFAATAGPCAVKGVNCSCPHPGNVCHVTGIQNLPGVLPPELVKLPYLEVINLNLNYLNGTIPREWGSMKLTKISLVGNRLSGSIPDEIGNITTLKYFLLDFNNFSGPIPQTLGDIIGISIISLTSNNFTGDLPQTFSKLTNLTDVRISDNQFSGRIPSFIKYWTNLERLEIQASGLEGPIPSDISVLEKLKTLKISDLKGTEGPFPPLNNMKILKYLFLRSCNINGTLPDYLGDMTSLKSLDLSFNNLSGKIPNTFARLAEVNNFMYLTGNFLNGPLPNWMRDGKVQNIDLSYNNFTLENSEGCQYRNTINLFGTSSMRKNSTGIPPCLKNSLSCQPNRRSFNINCGGGEYVYKDGDGTNTTYDADKDPGGPSEFHQSNNYWAFSSTGDFMDNSDGDTYTINRANTSLSMADPEIYLTARISPLSLTYYGFCLVNGNYIVKLHFAETILYTNDSFDSVGRRVFDVFVQGNLTLKDFDIVKAAGGAGKVHIESLPAVVTSNTLEIRFYWAGKGTQRVPGNGIYGPLVSAISVLNIDVVPRGKKIGAVVGIIVASVFCLVCSILGALWWKGYLGRKNEIDQELRGLDLNTNSFTLRQIKAATNNFAAENKIALILQENGILMDLVDPKLESEFDEEEVLLMINIALMCTDTSPTGRPKMSSVVSMLESRTPLDKLVSNSIRESKDDLKLKAIRDYHERNHGESMTDHSQAQSISKDFKCSESSTSAVDLYPLIMDSEYWNNRERSET